MPKARSAAGDSGALLPSSDDAVPSSDLATAKYGRRMAFVKNIAALQTGKTFVDVPRFFAWRRRRGRRRSAYASHALKKPRLTGCTSGACMKLMPRLFSKGSTKKKSVDSATTSLSVSGATAHMGSPGSRAALGIIENGGESRRMYQYAAPAKPKATAAGVMVRSIFFLSLSVDGASAAPICLRTSGRTALMIANAVDPSFVGFSTMSRA
mmetsp:Transcript_8075/g.20837  ORF Transcript_8075/g.20837 Transcript_8075/m.20837 type:complete len:210 (-) Transcript_8075:565-1194(-)